MSHPLPEPLTQDCAPATHPDPTGYLTALVQDPLFSAAADGYVPLSVRAAADPRDLLATSLETDRMVLVGAPGAGKTGALRALAVRMARAAGRGQGQIPVYIDLALARSGDGIDDLTARAMAAYSTPCPPLPALKNLRLLMDNLDRVTDVYLLEGLELLMRAGGSSSASVTLACREADWPAYRTWFDGVAVAAVEALADDAVAACLDRVLGPDGAEAARRWVARDRTLAALVRRPIGLQAFVRAVNARPVAEWRRSRVLDALLDARLAGVVSTEVAAYRAALGDVALGGVGRGVVLEVDTMAMGLGVTRDDMIRTGVVVARGAALEFVEPSLAHHCGALALVSCEAGDARAIVRRVAAIPENRRATVLGATLAIVPDAAGVVAALLERADGPELAARCLADPLAADEAGPIGAAAVVAALCARQPAVPATGLYQLGEALARLGCEAVAETAVRAALERMPDPVEIDALLNRPDVDAPPPVADWVRQFIAARNRGLALRGVRDAQGSLAAFHRADEALNLLAADLTFERGLSSAQSDRPAEAGAAFEAVLAVDPDRARYLFHHGQVLLSLGQAAEAVQQLQRARDLAPGRPQIEAALGEAYRARDWIDEALTSFETARVLAPEDPAYAQAVGELQAELGNLDAASEAMAAAVEMNGDVAGWHDALGQVLAERGRWPAALRAFQRADALAPDNGVFLRHLGRAQVAVGETGAAVATLERAAAVAPQAAGIQADLGLALASAGNIDAAIEALQRAVALDDGWPADHVWLARVLRDAGQLDAALDHAERSVAMAPSSGPAHAELGRVHQARGEFREAIAAFNQGAEAPREAGVGGTAGIDAVRATDDAYAADTGRAIDANRATDPALAANFDVVGASSGGGDRARPAPPAAPRMAMAPDRPEAGGLADVAQAFLDDGDATAALGALTRAAVLAPDVADHRRRAARLCLDLGRVDEAIEHLTQAAALAPTDVETQHLLGTTLRAAGELERAIGVLRRVVRLMPRDPDLLADLADVARRLGRLNEARAQVDAALEVAPDRADLYGIKADIELAAGATESACRALRQAHARAPEDPRYGLRLVDAGGFADPGEAGRVLTALAGHAPEAELDRRWAALHVAGGAWNDACAVLARAREAAPGDPELAAAHGQALREAGRAESAVDVLESAARAAGLHAGLHGQLAASYAAVGRFEAARQAYAVAADLGAPDPELLVRWSRLARDRGAVDEAIEGARRAVAGWPDAAVAHMALAEAYAAAGRPEAALEAVGTAVALAPDAADCRQLQARLACELGRYDEAIAWLEEGIADCGESGALQHALGCAFEARGWRAEARSAHGRAVECEPGNPTFQRALARQWMDDDLPRAIEATRLAVHSAPDDAEAAFELGVLLARAGDDEAALAPLRRAAGRLPDEPVYHLALGRCLARLGHGEAGEVLKRAAALDPRAAGAQAALGDWYARVGRFPAALDCYAAATRLAPDDAALWRALGTLRLTRGDTSGAVEALEKAARLDPADAETCGMLGLALEQAGRTGDAIRALEAAARIAADDPARQRRLGWARLAAGDVPGAGAAFTRATVLGPEDADAWRGLAETSRRQGMVLDAVRHAERAAQLAPEAASWRALAAAHRANHDLPAAAAALDRAADAAPDDPATALEQAEVAEASGDPDAARAAYRRAFALGAAMPEAAVRFGEILADNGWTRLLVAPEPPPPIDPAEAADAREWLEPLAVGAGPMAFRAARALALVCGRSGDAAAAVASAERAADQDDDPAMLLTLAWTRLLNGDSTGALEAIGLARALGLDDPTTHWLAGRAHRSRGDLTLAAEAFGRAAALAPDLAAVHAALGTARAALGQADAAFDAFRQALAIDPDGPWYSDLARHALDAGRATEALVDLEAGAARYPDEPVIRRALAAARRAAGDVDGAIAILDAAPGDAGASPGELADLGTLLAAAGDMGRAAEMYERVAALTGSADDHARVAESALALGRMDAARAAAEAALSAEPGQPLARAVRGRLQLLNGDAAAAAADLAVAAQGLPHDARCHLWLGEAARRQGDLGTAQASLETAAEIDDRACETFMLLGEVYLDQGALDDAIQAFQQAVVCAPDGVNGHLRLGEVCVTAGLIDKGLAHFRRSAELAPNDYRPWQALGRAHMAAGNLDEAVAALRAAIERQPERAELYFDLGQVYKERREFGPASEMFRHAMRLAPANPAAYSQFAAVSALNFLERSTARSVADEETEAGRG